MTRIMAGCANGAPAQVAIRAQLEVPNFGQQLCHAADRYLRSSPLVTNALRARYPSHPLLANGGNSSENLTQLVARNNAPTRIAKALSGIASIAAALTPAIATGLCLYQQNGNPLLTMTGFGIGFSLPLSLEVLQAGPIEMYYLLRDQLDRRFFHRGVDHLIAELSDGKSDSFEIIGSSPLLFNDFLETQVGGIFRGEQGRASGRIESLRSQATNLLRQIEEQLTSIRSQEALDEASGASLEARLARAQTDINNLIAEEVAKEEEIIEAINRFMEEMQTMQRDLRRESAALTTSEGVAEIEVSIARLEGDISRREEARIDSISRMAQHISHLQEMGNRLTNLLEARLEVDALLEEANHQFNTPAELVSQS